MHHQRILIVDDEPQLVELVQMRLEASGYEVLSAVDGQEGLKKARDEQPDVIILDLMLPKLNGYEVCTLLKQDARYQHIPIVILTAKTQQKDEALAMDCGADAYLRKPFKAEEMLEAIQKFIPGGSTPKEAEPWTR